MTTHSQPATESTTGDAGSELDWTKPGPGTWQLDGSHFEPDCARLAQRAIVQGVRDGMAQGFDVIGGPLKGLEAAFVNGNFYLRMVPLVGGDRDLPAPPAPLVWLLTRIHPTFRKQTKKAAKSLDGRVWNDELARWQTEHRPYLFEQSSRLAAENPTTMSDGELADHLSELIALVNHGTTLHFRLHVSDLGPIGLLLVRAREWGLDQVEVMTTLAGSSPATSAPMVALSKISDEAAGRGPFATLDEVRAATPQSARLLDAFLAEYGWRLTTGYDLQELTLHEMPELVLKAINAPGDGREPDEVERSAREAGRQAAERLRAQLQPSDRQEFDRLVDDARALYGLRDENGPLTYQWPAGLLRRALLEAGRRLTAAGRIADERHVFDLEADELIGLVTGGTAPGPEIAAARFAERRLWTEHQAPAILGPEVEDPPLWTMPPPLAKLMDVVITVLALIESDGTAPTLDGMGIGDKPCVGRARVVSDELDALARMEPCDVLIAPFTVPTYNAVLATAGAVVVENGGLLCHAAVIAREYGIPGLVGVTGVTDQITDGSMVRVDPVGGTIRQLAP
ncbi:MAG: PEP-utilizing enzyme [Acidimicrobiales bacterium]